MKIRYNSLLPKNLYFQYHWHQYYLLNFIGIKNLNGKYSSISQPVNFHPPGFARMISKKKKDIFHLFVIKSYF